MRSLTHPCLVRTLPVLLVVFLGVVLGAAQDQAAPSALEQEGGDHGPISGAVTDQPQAMIGGAKPLTISAGEKPEIRQCQNLTILNFLGLEQSV